MIELSPVHTMPQSIAQLKQKRGRCLANLTRTRRRAYVLIDNRGSRTHLISIISELDKALQQVEEASDNIASMLTSEDELEQVKAYQAEADRQHEEAVSRIEGYLKDRKDDPASEVSGQSHHSESSSAASRVAEVDAMVKKLELQQLQRRLKTEEEDQQLQRMLKLQEAEDAQAAAELRAKLLKEDSLNWDRREDFGEAENEENEEATGTTALQVFRSGGGMPGTQAQGPSTGTAAVHQAQVGGGVPGTQVEQGPSAGTTTAHRAQGSGGTGAFQSGLHAEAVRQSLPRLNLPKFGGEPAEWPKWSALFRTMVHNQPSLTPTEKMVHLQAAVTGVAEQAISGMLFDGRLYEEALKTLEERFGQQEDIVHAHLQNIFSCPNPSHLDPVLLEKLHSSIHCAVVIFKNFGYEGDLRSYENLRRVVQKLPPELKHEWGAHVLDLTQRPNLIDLDVWLQKKVRVAVNYAAVSQPRRTPKENKLKPMQKTAQQRSTLVTDARTTGNCPCCKERHEVTDCPLFLQKAVDERARWIAEVGRCFYCLQTGHGVRRCRSAKPCGIDNCTMRHHATLHGSKRVGRRTSRERVVAAASLKTDDVTTLLQVVPVTILGSNGESKQVCALLDPGSQTSLVSEDVVTELGLHGERQTLRLQSVEGCGPLQTSVKLKLELKASFGDGSSVVVPEAFSVKKINVTVPEIPHKMPDWKHVQDLDLPDCSGKTVELLLGANVLEALLQLEVKQGKKAQPVAIRTAFGWTLAGSVKGFIPERKRQVMLISRKSPDEDEMSKMLQQWWTTESFGCKFEGDDAKSPEDIRAVEVMKNTTRRLDNRYETGLLWKSDEVHLPDNRAVAVSRLHSLEKSLLRKPQKAEAYKKVMDGYVELGFARKLETEEEQESHPRTWYLPHHGVTNPRKPGKLRVVFDAAATCEGVSLNDMLLTGPNLLKNLPGILLRLREEPVALTADIEAMYHQVRIIQRDQAALRYLWRDLDVTKNPECYTMEVAIFGAKSSPASASFVLQQTARDCSSSTAAGQTAKEAALNSFYMDDFVHATETEDKAVEMQTEMTELLRKGGFKLTKWTTNSKRVMEQIKQEERAQAGTTQSVLGCTWNTAEDTLGVRSIDPHVPETKRGVVRGVARLYDPLGLLSPFSLQAKILIQRLWAGNYSWDDQLGEEESRIWKKWLSELPSTELMTVPRCFSGTEISADCTRELHIFCDASQQAFGAVAYVKTIMPDRPSICSLAMSKTRVAPLKQISIVRLELQAAVLGVRLANMILKELSVKVERVLFWTDSTVVLQYVRNDSRRFHTFVANRVAEIRELSRPDQWRHVPSSSNAADVCSRGASATDLSADSHWKDGPDFLLKDEKHWPENPPCKAVSADDPEVRTKQVLTTKPELEVTVLPDAGKFSSWTRYRRVVAWMLRFVTNFIASNCPTKADWKRQGPLSADEIQEAEKKIVLDCQARSFTTEVAALRNGNPAGSEGRLTQMSPFLDGDGVLRVGGRLSKAPVPYSTRHPAILPARDDVTRLIVTYNHSKVLHSGQERTLTEVRRAYWFTKARSTVRRILHQCTVCRNRRARPEVPRMADLPVGRFNTSRAFSTVGVDYFGPMMVKKFRKTEKRYGVLFTCLSTRAVRLEIANTLDTDSFIMALRRFSARRGKPDALFSDNGTNLVGGERELRESLQEFNQARISDHLSQDHIKWTFMPPGASHMGGAWERLVGSVKRALKVTIGSQCVSDEVLHTALLEVEAMVNGRPLTYVSPDGTDVEPLTPNHLLLGCSIVNISPGVFQPCELSSRRRWRQSQVLADLFWKRWRREYVPTLTSRQKWLRKTRNLQEGDVVRSVELKAAGGGTYHRPVSKVCLLEEAE
ncbi:uncharacterized protein LOC122371257 [Amphibalanus amphitrite]|uniref:uncharacterized protein LOC122371257 n=1 Tax=Amphibalanus amphitrite TaxID=1232801 RepID=UPI001C8FF1DA|nr:uncharacterized protein LOC122371257 [Amphibalanus amphitrite]